MLYILIGENPPFMDEPISYYWFTVLYCVYIYMYTVYPHDIPVKLVESHIAILKSQK